MSENENTPENSAEITQESAENTQENQGNTPNNGANTNQDSQSAEIIQTEAKQTPSGTLNNFSIKCEDSEKARFKSLEGPLTHGEFFKKLLDHYENPAEPQIITKEVEVIKKVEKEIPDNTILLPLSASQIELLKQISLRRFNKKAERAVKGTELSPEPLDQIIRAMVFNPDRLANLDNAYYTGVTEQMLK